MAQIVCTAGVNVSKPWLDVTLWPDAQVTLRVARNQDGFDTLARWLNAQGVSRVGLEASGGYEIAVMNALQRHGFTLIRFNVYRIRMFAMAIGRLAKNDRVDAAVIAQATAARGNSSSPAQEFCRAKPVPIRWAPAFGVLSCRHSI